MRGQRYACLAPKVLCVQLKLLIFAGQLFSGILADALLPDHFSLGQVAGGCLVTAGVVFSTWGDMKNRK